MSNSAVGDLNREAWLTELGAMLKPLFRGWDLKPYRITCGWPCKGGLSARRPVVGECHALESSRAGVHEIFISPVMDRPSDVAGTVCHEIAHVAAGIKAGHRGAFVKVCRHVGLTRNKPTSAAPGPELEHTLARYLVRLGPYPHAAVVPQTKACKPPQSLTLICPACECRCSMSVKWFAGAGAPTCACGVEMVPRLVVNEAIMGTLV